MKYTLHLYVLLVLLLRMNSLMEMLMAVMVAEERVLASFLNHFRVFWNYLTKLIIFKATVNLFAILKRGLVSMA